MRQRFVEADVDRHARADEARRVDVRNISKRASPMPTKIQVASSSTSASLARFDRESAPSAPPAATPSPPPAAPAHRRRRGDGSAASSARLQMRLAGEIRRRRNCAGSSGSVAGSQTCGVDAVQDSQIPSRPAREHAVEAASEARRCRVSCA